MSEDKWRKCFKEEEKMNTVEWAERLRWGWELTTEFENAILDHLSKSFFHGMVKTEAYLEIQERREV